MTIDPRVDQLRELRELEAAVRTEIASIEDALRAAMLVRGTDTLSGEACAARLEHSTSMRFDRNAFRLAHESLYQQYCKPVTRRRLVII